MRTTGTVARGIRAPLIKAGDDLCQIVVDCVLNAEINEGFALHNRDVLGITEAIVARSQGNYATCDQIAADIKAKFGGEELAIVFPILSRNRFSNILKGIAAGVKKLYILLSYPSDEVGNHLLSWEKIDASGVNPYSDVLNEQQFRAAFGFETIHPFTGLDYVEYYKSVGEHVEVLFANDPRAVLDYTKNVLCCDIHSRSRSKKLLREAGAEIVFGLDDILTESVNGSGYQPDYGLLGSNKSREDQVKLFPRDCPAFAEKVQTAIQQKTGKTLEVMVYGDGAFKDPVGKIWELADPVVSPGYTKGLDGTPNELKLKYMLDNEFAGKSEEEVKAAMEEAILAKTDDLGNKALGTTPRRYIDLLGSLCDLMSGSGDKGTPFVLIQGYFDNYVVGEAE